MTAPVSVRIGAERFEDVPRHVTITEPRAQWALRELMEAGPHGVTPIDNPAPRWSHYIFLLRRYGIDIETIHEAHGGPFAGTHARYVLRSHVTIEDDESEVAA